jgi:hypothetical protein
MNDIIDETVMTGDAVLGGSGGSGGLDIASGKLSISANAINSSRLAAGSVSNTNVSDTAAIVGTKISPDFGSQNIVTTGTINAGPSSLGYTFLKRADSNSEGGDLAFAKAIDNTSGFIIDCHGSTSSPDLRFISGSSVAATLTTSGNVGIGTTVPNYKLHVYDGNAAIINTAANAVVYVGESTGANEYGYLLWDRTNNTFKLGTQNNPIVFGTSSNDWMRLTTSGNLGIGTTTPLCKLAVTGTSGAQDGSGTEGIFQITTGTGANTDDKLQFGIVDSDYSWIQAVDPGTINRKLILNGAGGNVGVGKTNPSTALDVNGTVTATAFAGPLTGNVTGNVTGDVTGNVTGNAGTVTNGVYTTGNQTIGGTKTFSSTILLANGGFMFASDGAQDTGMSWSSDGVMNVVCNASTVGQFSSTGWSGNSATATSGPTNGTFTQDHTTDVNRIYIGGFGTNKGNGIWCQRADSTNGTALTFHNESGVQKGSIVITSTGTNFNGTSDYRLKEDLQQIVSPLDKLNNLNPVNFKWIGLNERTDGFIAHEVQSVVPNAVCGDKDAVDADGNPIYQQIDQSKLIPVLVGAIQELSRKVAELEAR